MILRTGYILGLLFVAMCAVAYPLTWERFGVVRYRGEKCLVFASVTFGRFAVGYAWNDVAHQGPAYTWTNVRTGRADELHAVKFERKFAGHSIRLPLWMPGLAVSLFMTWRWRRSRRRQSSGFPLDQQTIDPTKPST